jgi:hypothetical protein
LFFRRPSQSFLFFALALRLCVPLFSKPCFLFGPQALLIFTLLPEIGQALFFQPGRPQTILPRTLEPPLLFFELPARRVRLLARDPFVFLLAEYLGLLQLLESRHLPLDHRLIHDRRFDSHLLPRRWILRPAR